MFSNFDSSSYFMNFLVMLVLILPIYGITSSPIIRRLLLTFSGVYLVYFIAPRLLIFYLFFWLLVYILHKLITLVLNSKGEFVIFFIVLIICLVPMVAWKINHDEFTIGFNLIGNRALSYIHQDLQIIDFSKNIIIPIGLSFATFRAIDLIVKTYVGKIEKLSLEQVLFYGFFPPIQVVGPIIEYEEIKDSCNKDSFPSPKDLYAGLIRISFGAIKIYIIAALLVNSSSVFYANGDNSILEIWLYLFLYMWFFYLNFSGYSDLAIGSSRLLGFRLKENFLFPYFQKNLSEFWNCWHMSLSRFAQRNVYIPMGGYRKSTRNIATLFTMMVIALWHDLSAAMIVFGLYHGIGLIIHREVSERYLKLGFTYPLASKYISILITNLYVALSFPLLTLPLGGAILFYGKLIGLSQ